ncbi:MAG: TldD/PmbA family protein [Candidatus Cloacimonetes bacterium]|nr:TldD/PmbA family protein [Candidatus Cloacimonadota bacterium]
MYDNEFNAIFEKAKDKVDDIEILLSSGKSFSVRIHNQNVESFDYADSIGIGIRIIKDGRVGYAYTEELSDEAFSLIIKEAVANSETVENLEPVFFSNFPDLEQKLDIYSEELDKVKVEAKIDIAKKLESLALAADKRIFNVPYAAYSDGYGYAKIANSKGLHKESKTNHCVAFLMVLAQEGEDKKSGSDFIITRDFQKINPEKLVDKAVRQAIDLLNAEKPDTGQFPVVINNETMGALLSTFSGIFSAKNVQEGKSLLKGRIGQTIANSIVTIIDDGLHPDGMSTAPFDSEGYPSQKTLLINKGILTSFLHNNVTATIDKTKSTGNASRSYKSSLTVSPTNFVLQSGDYSKEDLLKSYDRIIELVSLQGLHSGANPISGDFSLAAEGFLYEKGVKKTGLSDFTVSGNFFQILQDIEKVGNDEIFNMQSCSAPSVLIKKISISSKSKQ